MLGCEFSFFWSNENCDTVSEALKIIQNSFCHWISRYIFLDQSRIEAKGIRNAFFRISTSEQECEIILCIVHMMRTWMTKIYKKKTHGIMNAMMHKRTKVDCKNLIQEAISNCAIPAI